MGDFDCCAVARPRVYISGSITNGGRITDPDAIETNRRAFFDVEARLRSSGLDPINPARHDPNAAASWLGFMRLALIDIASCDGVALLGNAWDSAGARIEQRLAADLGLPVKPWLQWVDPAIPEEVKP